MQISLSQSPAATQALHAPVVWPRGARPARAAPSSQVRPPSPSLPTGVRRPAVKHAPLPPPVTRRVPDRPHHRLTAADFPSDQLGGASAAD